ncbi:PREDICTED: tetratricopeptide repeat protein 28 isoform X4 [Cercocebus atys]|uniref:tetratricopeptide repeat protein 28 isoform X4 n=1 Tax=Cercocebus atys TaxID=9531 RepID=UPI0005F44972|nr:PREDICTED: tetratricopeptide repeat protein 28 isoform X4 [Cercocebus atys]
MEQSPPPAPEPTQGPTPARSRRRREPESPPASAPIPLFGANTFGQRSPDGPVLSKAEFVEKVRQSNQACHDGDFHTAIVLYNEALAVDPQNCILYSNRSAAYMKIQQYDKALDDAIKARLLNPKWPKAYFRQGVALQYLGRHADALAAFASGLAQDPKSLQLLVGMVEAAMKSPMRDSLEPTYQQLQKMKLDKSPFVVVSVVGQELLTAGHHGASVVVLEAALKIGTCSLKLRGSVFSALSSAYWSLGNTEKSTGYMQQDLDVAKTLGDQTGECRAHGNLGSAFFSKGNYREALTNHRHQLVLAMKLKDREAASSALSSLGHVYTAIGDYPNALASHKQCVLLAKQSKDELSEARELGNMGAVYIAMGDFENAVQCHEQHLKIAKDLGNKREEARAYSNLGSAYHYRRNFDKAMSYHNYVLELAQELMEKAIEMRAYAGLGHAARCMQDLERAKQYHEQQLGIAEDLKDRAAEGRASSNLGLRLAEQLGRREDEAKIRHGLGLSLWASGNLEEAQHQLYRASALFETIRHEAQLSTDYKLSLFDLQTSSYQALQRVLVTLGHHDEALAVAERGRTRAFADLLVERQTGQQDSDPYSPVTIDQILEMVNGQRGLVLYYSLAAGYLYSWLLAPGAGILKFNEHYLGENTVENSSDFQASSSATLPTATGSALEQHIASVREALGVESHYSRACASSETESEAGDIMDQQFEEMNNKLNSVTDPTGFLRMVRRNNLFNRSCQSMTSLFSNTVSPTQDGTSSLPRRQNSFAKPPLRALYDLLIAPMEGGLMHSSGPVGRHRQLILVLEGELYLIPFALLKGSSSNEYLYERFGLLAVPSIRSLSVQSKSHLRKNPPTYSSSTSMAAVIGNPKLPSAVMDRWLWGPMPSAEEEAYMVSELLGCQPLVGSVATKERVMSALTQAECVHFATHISWKLSALVLTPSMDGNPASSKSSFGHPYTIPESLRVQDDASDGESISDCPPLQELLLTAADVLDLQLPVKLVVLGSSQESNSKVTADGVIALTRAFLAAGAQCVLVSLWPVPVAASKMFIHAFYSSLLNGLKASAALGEAMKVVQSSKAFSHPSNWAGFMLIGSDVKLNSPSSLIGQALTEILQHPERARDALRVLLHLVEKSLQRIQNGQRNAMYTSQQSVENKVGGIPGWQALLTAVGFRLDPPTSGLPAAVFFPTSDPGDRLQQCSSTLQSLLGLPNPALQALCKLITASETGEQLISRAVKNMVGMLHQVLVQLQAGEKEQDLASAPIQVSISVQLWRLPGCHEFLAALGFDLCEVGQEEVILKTGKQANRRTVHFALQSLLSLFDSTELPKRLSLDSSSSLESLASAQSVSNALPLGYQHPPFSPTGADSIASDAISVYSLSSIASSMSFVSKPEGGSEGGGPGGRQDNDRSKNAYLQRSTLPRSQLPPQTRPAGNKDEEEYEGFSIISNEPLATYQENQNMCFSPDHKQPRPGTAGGSRVSVSSKGSISTPNSPVKMTLIPSPNSPFQKVGKLASSDTGESDQSSTETDSTVKSQEESNPKLDPQELAQKILEETQSHLIAVERLQRSGGQVSKSNNPEDGVQAPSSAAVFRASETSAFSRPVLSHQKSQPSPVTVKPKPPARSSSLPKVSSGYSSPTTSETSIKDSPSQNSGRPSPGSDSQTSQLDQPLFKLKYPSSPYSAHISKSPRNMSPSSGHQSPAGSAPSPALSYSSAGSARSSPADAPDIDKLKMAAIDEKVQAVHNLKMFWQSTPQHSTGPMKIFRGAPGTMTSKRDVLSLLNLSPRHNKKEEGVDKLELKELSLQQHEGAPPKAPPNGHWRTETTSLGALPLPAGPSAAAPARPLRLPSGNGYKFLSPGRFFPSSKC